MNNLESTDALMRDLGPDADSIEAVIKRGSGRWAILLADGGELTAELDLESGGLALMLPVAAPAASERLRVYEAALLYNSLWRDTAGARLAMAGENGTITVGLEVPVAALDLAALQSAIALLCSRAETWREVIGAGPTPDSPPEHRIQG